MLITPRSTLWIGLALLLAACTAPAASVTPTPANDEAVRTVSPRSAQLSELRNAVTTRDTNAAEWGGAAEGQTFTVSGGVRTGEDSRARVDTSEGSIVRVAANTEFELLEFPPGTQNPITKLKLEAGKLWIVVTRALADGKFEIETPSGVATVRGSLMSVEQAIGAGPLLITCLEGVCRLGNPTGNFVDLVAGQQSAIAAPGQDPTSPTPMTTTQFQDWLQNVPEAVTAATNFLSVSAATPTPTPPGPSAGSSLPGGGANLSGPRLAFDNQDTLHLVYEARGARVNNDYFHQQLPPGGAWTEPEALSADFAFLFGSLTLLPNEAGVACVYWSGALTGTSDQGFFRRCREGAGWSAPESVARSLGTMRDYSLAYTPEGQLRTLYVGGAGTVYLDSHNLGAAEDDVEDPQLSGEALAVQARLAIDARGGYHVAWVNLGQASGDPFTVEYRYSSDGGQTWTQPQTLSEAENAPDGLRLQLKADAQGNLHLTWNTSNGLYFRRWTNTEGWGAAINIAGEEDGPWTVLAVNADGLARAVWYRDDGVRYVAQNVDGTWPPPRVVAAATNLDVGLAVDAQGQAHVVWIKDDALRYSTMP
ncbi:MAG: FecR family protein [Anaerolineales bacterium]